MPYVLAADILANAGVDNPTPADQDWADKVVAALEGAIAERLTGFTPTASQTAELERAALLDGMAAYAERKAPHGILTIGPDGNVARLGRDIIRALEPVMFRIAGPGIG